MEDGLNSLKRLFPDLLEERLRDALESSGFDLDVACSILLSAMEPSSNKEQEQLYELMNMFPDLSKIEIQEALGARDGNMEETIYDLLTISSLSKEERQAQTLQKDNKINENIKDRNWSDLNEKLEIIMNYGDVPKKIAEKLYYDEHFDAIRALIKLVISHEEIIQEYRQQLPLSLHKNQRKLSSMSRVGRVQTRNGFAHLKQRKQTIDSSIQSTEGLSSASDEYTKFLTPREYKYEPWNRTAEELDTYVQQNVKFKSINKRFLQKSLEFYNGDIKRTILLLVLIIDEGYAKFTGKYATNADVSLQFKHNSSVRNFPKIEKPPSQYSSSTLLSSNLRDPSIYNKALRMTKDILVTYTLDFHLFLPEDAETITAKCLDIWWKEEITLRELNAKKLTNPKISFLLPIKIITGRGIHSVGGIPKVRQRIKKFLTNKNYIFEEESSYFVVIGKR